MSFFFFFACCVPVPFNLRITTLQRASQQQHLHDRYLACNFFLNAILHLERHRGRTNPPSPARKKKKINKSNSDRSQVNPIKLPSLWLPFARMASVSCGRSCMRAVPHAGRKEGKGKQSRAKQFVLNPKETIHHTVPEGKPAFPGRLFSPTVLSDPCSVHKNYLNLFPCLFPLPKRNGRVGYRPLCIHITYWMLARDPPRRRLRRSVTACQVLDIFFFGS